MSANKMRHNYLEVDPTIVENKLKIPELHATDEEGLFFPDPRPSKMVKPAPGFCVKTRQVDTQQKFFVNVCTTDAIPPPKDVTEAELIEIIDTEDTTFRVPMSIGELRTEKDKKGEEARVCDIAVNEKFFEKLEKSQVFRNFVMAIIFEGLANKHGVQAVEERILLRNRKAFGTLQMHRIEQREIDQKMGGKPEELRVGPSMGPKKPVIEVLDGDLEYKKPQYLLYKEVKGDGQLYLKVKLPTVPNSKNVTFDLTEDRVIVEAKKERYLLDIFLPVNVIMDEVKTCFNKETKVLTSMMAIAPEPMSVS